MIPRALAALLCIGAVMPVHASEWTKADTAWEAGYLVLHVIDWGQTRNMSRRPDAYRELNPILGSHPSVERVNTYFALTAIAHTAISYALPSDWRRGWQMFNIGMKVTAVSNNYQIGLKIDF